MNRTHSFQIAALSFTVCLLGACSVDKLEARLQADPQCKQVMNAKTGALMPCPGTEKTFYKSIPSLNVSAPQTTQVEASRIAVSASPRTSKAIIAPVECKPQIHQKSGSLMPCPAP